MFREFGPRLSVLMFHASHPNLRISLCPNLHLADDLLQAAALIWAHGMRFQSSISLPYNEFHLAHKMPLQMREARPGT